MVRFGRGPGYEQDSDPYIVNFQTRSRRDPSGYQFLTIYVLVCVGTPGERDYRRTNLWYQPEVAQQTHGKQEYRRTNLWYYSKVLTHEERPEMILGGSWEGPERVLGGSVERFWQQQQ